MSRPRARPDPRQPTRRAGPRPLPLHLSLAGWSAATSPIASAMSSSGSLPWSGEHAPSAGALRKALAGVAPERFGEAVSQAARHRLDRFLEGVQRYQHFPHQRAMDEPPCLWREGSARLLDHGVGLPPGAPTLLVVPSLVNRAYILDLAPDRSLMRHLAGAGIRPLLLDWGQPGTIEAGFDLTDYIAGPLEGALDAALDRTAGRPVGLLGYCMGGTMALALAGRRRRQIGALALLATPWDFHADGDGARRLAAWGPTLAGFANWTGAMPADLLQCLFAGLDPFLAVRKFERFALMSEEPARRFVELEDWANDGVPLAGPVARDCILDWYGRNLPAQGTWRIAGRVVDPARFDGPVLLAIPERDRIVPPASAMALAKAWPDAQILRLPLGHVGMMASPAAPARLWQPLADWCLAHMEPAGLEPAGSTP